MRTGVGGTDHEERFRSYRTRWYMLSVLSLLNFSNGLIWISFSNIAESTSVYFKVSTFQVDLLSIVFMVSTLVLGIPAMWLLDKYGLRLSLNIAAWTNCLGSIIRFLGTLQCFGGTKYFVLLLGQTLAGCGQPFMIFAPTKLVALWFPPGERIFANSIGSLANPLGFSIGGLLSTLLVCRSQDPGLLQQQMELMIGVMAIPACIGGLMTLGVLNSKPPTEPSPSASHEIEPFFCGLKMLSGMRPYILLVFCYGTGVGIISSLVTIANQLLVPQGYSDVFSAAGVCLLVTSGLVGASVASYLAEKFKNQELVAKVSFCLGAAFILLFIVLSHFPDLAWLISLILVISGFFCLSISPVCLELSVECSYPVAVGTSSGLMVTFGQLMSALMTLLLSLGSQPISTSNQSGIINQYSLVAFMLVVAPTPLIFLLLFTSPDRRLSFERMTSSLDLLPPSERDRVVAAIMESHARCTCNRPEVVEPPLVMEVEAGSDILPGQSSARALGGHVAGGC